jgi:hypothetical protein
MGATVSIIGFYMIGQIRAGQNWMRSCLDLPMTLAIGIGLSINNTRAVIEACLGHKTPFVRTPKLAASNIDKKHTRKANYQSHLNFIPIFEVAVSVLYIYCMFFCIWNEIWTALPFMMLFAYGYGYVGLTSLFQGMMIKKNSEQPVPSQHIA